MLLSWYEVSSVILEGLEDLLPVLLWIDEALLTRADDAVVEDTSADDGLGSFVVVDMLVEDDLHVASTYAKGRLARRVSRVYHAHTTRSDYDVDSRHKILRGLDRGLGDALDEVLGYVELLETLQYELDGMCGAVLRAWVWRDDDSVARLEREGNVCHWSDDRIGRRGDSSDDTYGLSDLDETGLLVDV